MADQRFVGYRDEPPEGMRFAGHAYGSHRYDIWTNGKSMFAPEFRWAMVPRDAKGASDGVSRRTPREGDEAHERVR